MVKKNNKVGLLYAVFIVFIILVLIIGFGQGNTLSEENTTFLYNFAIDTTIVFFSIIFFFIGHIIIHELGHLLAGKLSGYRFLFFRIFKWTLLKNNGKLTWTTLSIAGTGGQCLMLPPKNNPDPPYLFYLLGGVQANAFTALLALVMYLWWPSIILLIFAIIGLISCAINGIPSGFNDGMMIKKIRENSIVKKQLMQQLEWTGKFTTGATYTDFDKKEIVYNPQAPMTEQSNVYGQLIEMNSCLEKGKLEEAKDILQPLWEKKEEIVAPYQIEVIREFLFCYLLLHESNALIIDEALKNPLFVNHLNSNQTDSYRIQAALAFYKDKDKAKAEEWLNKARTKLVDAKLAVEQTVNTVLLDSLEQNINR